MSPLLTRITACPTPTTPRRRFSSGFFFSSRRRHTRFDCDWSSDVCSSDLDGNRIHILPLGVYKAPGSFNFHRIFSGPNVDLRIPDVNLAQTTNVDYTSNWMPWNNTADDYQIKDDLS